MEVICCPHILIGARTTEIEPIGALGMEKQGRAPAIDELAGVVERGTFRGNKRHFDAILAEQGCCYFFIGTKRQWRRAFDENGVICQRESKRIEILLRGGRRRAVVRQNLITRQRLHR